MSTAAIAAGTIGAIGSIGGAAIGANASQTAAGDQSQAAEQAAELQYEESQQALQFEEGEYGQSQNNLAVTGKLDAHPVNSSMNFRGDWVKADCGAVKPFSARSMPATSPPPPR